MSLKKGKKKLKSTNDSLKTLVAIVLDETGSMDGRREETISSINYYLEGILEDDSTVVVTLAEFSDMGTTEEKVRFLEKNTPIVDTYELTMDTYRPRGNTPLYDAVGLTIRAIERENVDRFLFVIVTDGYENASREFTREKIVQLITEKERTDKWTFVYLAAGQDAWTGAQSIGITSINNTLSVTPANLPYGLGQFRGSTASYLASAVTSSKTFVDENELDEDKLLHSSSDDKVKVTN